MPRRSCRRTARGRARGRAGPGRSAREPYVVLEGVGIGHLHELTQRTRKGSERDRFADELDATSGEYEGVPRRESEDGLLDDAALADPRFSGDEHGGRSGVDQPLVGPIEHGELLRATDKTGSDAAQHERCDVR